MSSAITQSTAKIVSGYTGAAFVRNSVVATSNANQLVTSPVNGSATRPTDLEKALHPHYDWSFQPTSNFASNCFTYPTYFQFDIQNTVGYYMEDHDQMTLEINLAETGGTNSVTPTAAEWLFDEIKAVEYYCDGQLFHTCPAYQTMLVPALEQNDNDYSKTCVGMNHNSSLLYTSPASIAASGSTTLWMRVPNPFEEGFYFGALGDHTLSIRFNTANGVQAGTGVLSCPNALLHINSHMIPEDEQKAMNILWANRSWRGLNVITNRPSAITLVASGDSPSVKLDSFRDQELFFLLTLPRASRAIAAGAYLNFTQLPNTAKVRITDQSGNNIFASNPLKLAITRYVESTKSLPDSSFMENTWLIPHYITPNLHDALHEGVVDATFLFTGNEYVIVTDSGSTASNYLDTIGFGYRMFWVKDGKFFTYGA